MLERGLPTALTCVCWAQERSLHRVHVQDPPEPPGSTAERRDGPEVICVATPLLCPWVKQLGDRLPRANTGPEQLLSSSPLPSTLQAAKRPSAPNSHPCPPPACHTKTHCTIDHTAGHPDRHTSPLPPGPSTHNPHGWSVTCPGSCFAAMLPARERQFLGSEENQSLGFGHTGRG